MDWGAVWARIRPYHDDMDSDKLASMYAQVVSGVSKSKSHLVTDAESSKAWDRLETEVADLRRQHPKGVFSIPNEVPTL